MNAAAAKRVAPPAGEKRAAGHDVGFAAFEPGK
jgi:hypothetical protein